MRIICDFDGTITRQDTTDWVLEALAKPAWRAVEAQWVSGRITAAECMRRQVAMIQGSGEDLDAVLDAVELDPGFVEFVDWCETHRFPVSVVSDGVDYFIGRILARHGLERLPVIANRLTGAAGRRRLRQPWSREGCAAGSGVCKCAAAVTEAALPAHPTLVFVGDGRSDFCISHRADVLFAKGALADYAAAREQPYFGYDTFDDVTRALARLVAEPAKGLGRVATL